MFRMRCPLVSVAVLLIGAVLLQACGGANPNKQRDELVTQWKEIADAALKEVHKEADTQRAENIASQLAHLGPTGIDPLLDILADPNSNPRTKMLVTISLTRAIAKANMPRIIELTDARYDVNTRVNAAHLIASIEDPDLDKRCAELLKDPEVRVRLQVFHMKLLRSDPGVLALLDDFWNDKATPDNDRTQIVLGTPEVEAQNHLNIFTEAVVNPRIDGLARQRAITILGRVGEASSLAGLESVAKKDPDPEMRKQAEAAYEAAKARLDGGTGTATAVPVPSPTPEAEPAASVPPSAK